MNFMTFVGGVDNWSRRYSRRISTRKAGQLRKVAGTNGFWRFAVILQSILLFCQAILFSATMPPEIYEVAETFLQRQLEVRHLPRWGMRIVSWKDCFEEMDFPSSLGDSCEGRRQRRQRSVRGESSVSVRASIRSQEDRQRYYYLLRC